MAVGDGDGNNGGADGADDKSKSGDGSADADKDKSGGDPQKKISAQQEEIERHVRQKQEAERERDELREFKKETERAKMDETQKAVVQLNSILGDARESLRKADAVLADVQKIGANASTATQGLGALRSEVDASLRKVNSLIDEVNRKWPFKRDLELKLP